MFENSVLPVSIVAGVSADAALVDDFFDEQFGGVRHFNIYPKLMPWVGSNFRSAPAKILVLGESHYLRPTSRYHLDPKD